MSDNSKGTADKFNGKSLEEIASAYQALEAKMGQQSAELGQLRKQVNQKPAASEAQIKAMMQEDPEKAIKMVEERAKRKAEAEALLRSKHADKDTVLASAEFKSFLESGTIPKPFVKAFDEAEQEGDPEGIAFALDMFKARNKPQTPESSMSTSFPGISPGSLKEKPKLTREDIARMSEAEYKDRNDEILEYYRSLGA